MIDEFQNMSCDHYIVIHRSELMIINEFRYIGGYRNPRAIVSLQDNNFRGTCRIFSSRGL